MQNNKIFNICEWRETCQRLSKDAAGRCGLIHDVYVEIYSSEIEKRVSLFTEEHHKQALEIASQKGDYATPEEREQETQWNSENGYCKHGLEPDCCPLGCGEM